MACMLCKTLVFDTELEARKSHAMSDHVAGDLTSLSANGLFRLVSECFPDAGFQACVCYTNDRKLIFFNSHLSAKFVPKLIFKPFLNNTNSKSSLKLKA